MGAVKNILLMAILALIIWGGYVAYAVLTLHPTFNAGWGYVNENITELQISGNLGRPLLVPLSIKGVTLTLNNIEIATVKHFEYHATSSKVSVVVVMSNANLIKAFIAYMNNGERGKATLHIKGTLLGIIPVNQSLSREIHEDVLSGFNFTAESRPITVGGVEIGDTPAILGTRTEWGGTKGNYAIIICHARLYNPNRVPVPVKNISYVIRVDGIKLGKGSIIKGTVIPANGYGTVNARILINTAVLPEVWAAHVKAGEESTVSATVYLDISLLGENYRIPIETTSARVKTNFIGTLRNLLNG